MLSRTIHPVKGPVVVGSFGLGTRHALADQLEIIQSERHVHHGRGWRLGMGINHSLIPKESEISDGRF